MNCLAEVCKPGELTTAKDLPWLPESPNQWWRVFVCLLHHQGIIIVAIVISGQYLLFIQVEETAGWLRVMIIYLITGAASTLVNNFNDHFIMYHYSSWKLKVTTRFKLKLCSENVQLSSLVKTNIMS